MRSLFNLGLHKLPKKDRKADLLMVHDGSMSDLFYMNTYNLYIYVLLDKLSNVIFRIHDLKYTQMYKTWDGYHGLLTPRETNRQ